jgi:hypothetical protein
MGLFLECVSKLGFVMMGASLVFWVPFFPGFDRFMCDPAFGRFFYTIGDDVETRVLTIVGRLKKRSLRQLSTGPSAISGQAPPSNRRPIATIRAEIGMRLGGIRRRTGRR